MDETGVALTGNCGRSSPQVCEPCQFEGSVLVKRMLDMFVLYIRSLNTVAVLREFYYSAGALALACGRSRIRKPAALSVVLGTCSWIIVANMTEIKFNKE